MNNKSKIKTKKTKKKSPNSPKDAFEFMMNQRSKIIGRNSPGKDQINDSQINGCNDSKKMIKRTRTKMLEEWSDKKGAAKRKRNYIDQGNIIQLKLEERSKKLKEMLNISNPLPQTTKSNQNDSDDDEIILYKSKKPQILDSSESDIEIVTETIHVNQGKENEFKRVLRPRRSVPIMLTSDDDDDDDDFEEIYKKKKQPKKLAPVFIKATKEDPKVLEARRNFLMSETPNYVRKEFTKEILDLEIFPKISHVQQKTDSHLWNLPKINLNLKNIEAFVHDCENFQWKNLNFINENLSEIPHENHFKPVENIKEIIKSIKKENTNYPVYKCYVSLSEKHTNKNLKYSLWTEKYRSQKSSDIFGNNKSVNFLKTWLKHWNEKKVANCSDSDFDSEDSSKPFQNTLILKGPNGCGKTNAIYAICNELGYKVLELNASSKRTGKKLLQEWQEATQSHRVKNDYLLKEPNENRAISILLIEDVDLIFDQDEGFISALSQLTKISKRPIILTTTDPSSGNVQKFTNNYETIEFRPLTPKTTTIWLQILCALEGHLVEKDKLSKLLESNKGDLRKTILQLQFSINSINLNNSPFNLDETSYLISSENIPINSEENLNERRKSVEKLGKISSFCDNLSLVDCLCRREMIKLKDSLELKIPSITYNSSDELRQIIGHTLFILNNKSLQLELLGTTTSTSIGSDVEKERQFIELFVNCLPLSSTDQNALNLDYLSAFRIIARSERQRAQSNTKRNNRFYNYLSNFQNDYKKNNFELFANILNSS